MTLLFFHTFVSCEDDRLPDNEPLDGVGDDPEEEPEPKPAQHYLQHALDVPVDLTAYSYRKI